MFLVRALHPLRSKLATVEWLLHTLQSEVTVDIFEEKEIEGSRGGGERERDVSGNSGVGIINAFGPSARGLHVSIAAASQIVG